jgi:hypothetical protein
MANATREVRFAQRALLFAFREFFLRCLQNAAPRNVSRHLGLRKIRRPCEPFFRVVCRLEGELNRDSPGSAVVNQLAVPEECSSEQD